MNALRQLWPSLGDGYIRTERRGWPTSTKKGPGRYHQPGYPKLKRRKKQAALAKLDN